MRAEDFFEPRRGVSGVMPANTAREIDASSSAAKVERKKKRVRKALARGAGAAPDREMSERIRDAQRGLVKSAAAWWDAAPEGSQELLLAAVARLQQGLVSQAEYREAHVAVKREAVGDPGPARSYGISHAWGAPLRNGW